MQTKELSESLEWLEERLRRVRKGDASEAMWAFILARLASMRRLAAEMEGGDQCRMPS